LCHNHRRIRQIRQPEPILPAKLRRELAHVNTPHVTHDPILGIIICTHGIDFTDKARALVGAMLEFPQMLADTLASQVLANFHDGRNN
jgi:hypothetical protein